MKARFTKLLLLLCMLCMVCNSALAAEGLTLTCLFGTPIDDQANTQIALYSTSAQLSGLTFSADGVPMPVQEIKAYSHTELGTTWLIVVDTSSSNRDTSIRKAVETVVDTIGENDNFAIITTDTDTNQVVSSIQLLNSSETAQASSRFNAHIFGKGKNDLGKTLSQALKYDGADVKARLCVMVFSSVSDNSMSLTNIQNAAEVAGKRNATMYAFAFTKNADSENVEIFASLGNIGNGSIFREIAFSDGLKTMDYVNTMTKALTANESLFRVVSTSFAGLSAAPQTVQVSLKDGANTITTVIPLTAEEQTALNALLSGLPTPTPTPTPGPIPTPTPTFPSLEWFQMVFGDLPSYFVAIMAIGLIVLLTLVTLLVVQRMRNKNSNAAQAAPETMIMEQPDKTEVLRDQPDGTGIELKIVIENSAQPEVVTRWLSNTLILGRDVGADVVIRGDGSVSKQHAELSLRRGVVYINDYASSNGTFVNGLRLSGAVVLHQNDTIRLGKTQVKIVWTA